MNYLELFKKGEYDPMALGAAVQEVSRSKGVMPAIYFGDSEAWEDSLEFCMDAVKAKVAMPKDAPAKVKAAYDNYYAQKNRKKSTRDTVVAKVKKSRSK